MTYWYAPTERPEIPYRIAVSPDRAADVATAIVHAGSETGAVVERVPLERESGCHALALDLAGRTTADSPLFVELVVRKGDREQRQVRAVALADVAPAEIDAPPIASAGETVTLEVSAWQARTYDSAGQAPTPQPLEEPEPARIPEELRARTRWRVGSMDLVDRGARASYTPSPSDQGREIAVEAHVDDTPSGRATKRIFVPCDLVLHDADHPSGLNLIALVARFEAAYPECRADSRLCVTMLRKVTQYSSPVWDDLIAARSRIRRPAVPPMAAGDHAALGPDRACLPSVPEAAASSILGRIVDWKHIICAIDSWNYPQMSPSWIAASQLLFADTGTEAAARTLVGPVAAVATLEDALEALTAAYATGGGRLEHTMEAPAAASWSGDVGSALAEYELGTEPSLSHDRESYYTAFASNHDMLGDVDGIAFAHVLGRTWNVPLSRMLCRYYCGAGETPPPARRRFHHFCEASGLTLDASGHVDAASRDHVRRQIRVFARLWRIKKLRDANDPHPYRAPFDHPAPDDLAWFTDRFLRDVNGGLDAERDS